MCLVGDYNISLYKENKYLVQWMDGNKYCSINLDLANSLKELVNNKLKTIQHFVNLFHMAVNGDEESFLNHPDHIIINYLDANSAPNPSKLDSDELLKEHISKFLKAYNKWKGTSLEYYEVAELCKQPRH